MTEDNSSQLVTATAAADDWTARYTMHERRLADARPINSAAVFANLAEAGITHVAVNFDGYGDSGQIESVEAKAGDTVVEIPSIEVEWAAAVWGESEPERSRIPLRDAIENVAYDCLEQTRPGWEINDGAYGDFTFNVAERTITLDYNERYTSSECFQYTF